MMIPSPFEPFPFPLCACVRVWMKYLDTPPLRRAAQNRYPLRFHSSCASSFCVPSPRPSSFFASCPSSSCRDYPPDHNHHPRHSAAAHTINQLSQYMLLF